MESLKSCIDYAKEILKENGIPDVDQSIKYILAISTNTPAEDVTKIKSLSAEEFKKFNKLLKERCRHIPLDKIIGYKYFLDVKIPYSKSTLTPRQETEILADMVVKEILAEKKSERYLLDLCTGSGCVGLSIANATGINVTMSDVDALAITDAKKNTKLNNEIRQEKGLPPINPNIIKSDLFEDLPYKFDYIVCNPPYIKSSDLEKLELEVRDFDPRVALDGGKDGLDFYRQIIKSAPKHLNCNGKLYLEVGYDQAQLVAKLLSKDFENIKIVKDYSGIERFIIAKKREKDA